MTTLEVTLDLPDRMAREAQAAGAARADLLVTGDEDLLGEPRPQDRHCTLAADAVAQGASPTALIRPWLYRSA